MDVFPFSRMKVSIVPCIEPSMHMRAVSESAAGYDFNVNTYNIKTKFFFLLLLQCEGTSSMYWR